MKIKSFLSQLIEAINTPGPNDLLKLSDRFARARWIEESAITAAPFAFRWSQLGRERLTAIIALLKRRLPQVFDPTQPKMSWLDSLSFSFELRRLTKELRPPGLWLSNREKWALIGMAIVIANDPESLIVYRDTMAD